MPPIPHPHVLLFSTWGPLIVKVTGELALLKYLAMADDIDRAEGKLAYERYNVLLSQIAERYGATLPVTVAAFCALSPNSDYVGNLRSTITVLKAVREGVPCHEVKVSTYKHCRDRAYGYVTGERDFLREVKGPKIWNFYHNLMDPTDVRWVTVDGHMVAIWRDDMNATMKESIIRNRDYKEIKAAVQRLAFQRFEVPNQLQATLWFVRKRLKRQGYMPQGSLWHLGDHWRTLRDIDQLEPYA